MSLSKITLFALATLAVISTLVAKLQNIVHISNDIEYRDIKKVLQDDTYPDGRPRHLMWFLQISDLHLSVFHAYSRLSDLNDFCNETVSVIKPAVVLATGDLVDARTKDLLGSKQFEKEWEWYQQVLNETGVTNNTIWLDIRGNHDNFNVLDMNNVGDLYRKYSVQGSKYRRSYKYTLNHDTEVYNFIGIDACMNPGPKRPFNFLGVLQKDEFSHIENLVKDSEGNFTVWFGHYPTSTIVSPHPGIRELMRSSGPYLCGHLHTLGGIVPEMYTLQSNGVLELELADWKENRKYRICAVDHGIFSFIDHYIREWPLILVTNPKDALLTMPSIEPLYRILKSTHIRVLIFSPYPIEAAKLKINDGDWQILRSTDPPLYTVQWDPLKYIEGLHKMVIFAKDVHGNQKTLHHDFALDGTRPTFPLGARLALMGHISVGQAIFGVILLLILLPLCGLRIYLYFAKDIQSRCQDITKRPKARRLLLFFFSCNGDAIKAMSEVNCCRRFLFKMSLLVSVDELFWPIVLCALYVAVGPWFIGYIIDESIGICFVWGIILAGHFLPGGLTYFVGTAYLISFYIPFILCLSHCLYHHYLNLTTPEPCNVSYTMRHSLMLLFIIWQALSAAHYFYSYGTMALLLGFLHSWSIILALVLWRVAVTLPETKLHGLPLLKPRPSVGAPLIPDDKSNRQMNQLSSHVLTPS